MTTDQPTLTCIELLWAAKHMAMGTQNCVKAHLIWIIANEKLFAKSRAIYLASLAFCTFPLVYDHKWHNQNTWIQSLYINYWSFSYSHEEDEMRLIHRLDRFVRIQPLENLKMDIAKFDIWIILNLMYHGTCSQITVFTFSSSLTFLGSQFALQ